MTTDIILHHIRQLGWTVSIHNVNRTVEMHAVHLAGKRTPQIARCNDGEIAFRMTVGRLFWPSAQRAVSLSGRRSLGKSMQLQHVEARVCGENLRQKDIEKSEVD
jgi:hypothetical protein